MPTSEELLSARGWVSLPGPIVVFANFYQFGSGDLALNPSVHSRTLLWCKAGRGSIRVNRATPAQIEPEQYVMLPWGHAIQYQASHRHPFLLGAIHIIPRHEAGLEMGGAAPIDFAVAHRREDPLASHAGRRDAPLAIGEEVIAGSLAWSPGLAQLAEYTVQVFMRRPPPEWQARWLAHLLINELGHARRQTDPTAGHLPRDLQRIMQYAYDHMSRPLTLSDLVEFTGLSASTIGRLFRKHTRQTPGQWILRVKLDKAQQLLRTSRLSVAEVGREVGILDPFYFSKLFKKRMGVSPQTYRSQNDRL